MADQVEIEVDLGGTREQKMTVVNPGEFMDWTGDLNTLYLFQFGAYGTTWLLVWRETGGMEDALEEAAGWLADNAPGHITSEKELYDELYKDAAKDAGLPWPPPDDVDWNEQPWSDVRESAEADMTYTESGWLTSYEWWGEEEDFNSPTYLAAFEASLEDQIDEMDEEVVEKAEKLLEDLKRNVKTKKIKGTSQLKSKLLR